MTLHRRCPRRAAIVAAGVLLATATAALAGRATAAEPQGAILLAQEVGQPVDEPPIQAPPRELEPRYQPVPPPQKSWYNDSYIFAATRGVADSTLVPAAKAPLYLLTVPLDLILLPFATIGGLFG